MNLGSSFGHFSRRPGESPERDAAGDERMMASLGYLFWPLALPTILDAGRARSEWLHFHARQAAVFGVCSWIALFGIFSFPLILLLNGIVPYEATLTLYSAAIFIDLMAIGLGFAIALRAAQRASRGERFALRELLPMTKKDLP